MKRLGLILIVIALILALAPFTLYFIPANVNLLLIPLFLLVNTLRMGNYGVILYAIVVFAVLILGLEMYKHK